MSLHRNRVQMTVTGAPGTGTITLNAATTGYQSFSSAYGANATVDILITEGTSWEVARNCTYTNSGTTVTRGTLEASSTGSAVTFTSAAIVSVIATANFGNAADTVLSSLGALDGENSITGTATALISRMNVCSGTSADYTVTLPAVSGNAGRYIGFRMATGLTRFVTLDGNASETIDGQTTRVMWAEETALLYCDGSAWFKIAGKSLPMAAGMYLSAEQTGVLNSTVTKVNLNTQDFDNTGRIVDTANNRMTARRTGNYIVGGKVCFSTPAGAALGAASRGNVQIYVNGSQVSAAEASATAGSYLTPYIATVQNITSGHHIELYGFQNSGGTKGFYSSSMKETQLNMVEVPAW